MFPVETQPAPLSGGDRRLDEYADILKIGVSKRCDHTPEFPEDSFKKAMSHYEDKVMTTMKPPRAELKPLTMVQAIEGFPGQEHWESISMKTAEGFPWVKMRPNKEKDKKWMFDLEYTDCGFKVNGIYRPLYDTILNKEIMREKGLVPPSYFSACLKDARILLEKVKIPGKTRVFEICPVDLTISQRMYYKEYNVAYKTHRWEMENTIGIDVDGPQWTRLVNELTDFSPFLATADFGGFGPGTKHQVLEAVISNRNKWYFQKETLDLEQRERNFKIREVMKYEISKGLHVVKNLVFVPTCGLPSGNPDTVELNSEDNSIYIRIAFLELAKEFCPHYADLYWFDKKVKMFHNGDDLIISIKEDILFWFNNQTLIDFFARYRIKMTDGGKTGNVSKSCFIEQATYLKRGFKKHPYREGEWLAPLDIRSVTDTANWIWKDHNIRDASLQNSEMACRLAYGHGPTIYRAICDRIKQIWIEKDINFQYPSWESLDNHIWEGKEAPKYSF